MDDGAVTAWRSEHLREDFLQGHAREVDDEAGALVPDEEGAAWCRGPCRRSCRTWRQRDPRKEGR
jgi:hypothetical protein